MPCHVDDARRRESRQALKRLVVAGFGAMQAMMYASALYLGALDASDSTTRDLMRWLGLLVATPVVFYAAAPFFGGAVRALRARYFRTKRRTTCLSNSGRSPAPSAHSIMNLYICCVTRGTSARV